MASVSEIYIRKRHNPIFICDVSPTRGSNFAPLEIVQEVGADFLCVAYSPGKSVRVESSAIAHLLKQSGSDVIFNLACRDMNKLAIQNHLLGAQVLGLENVIVVKGDDFTDDELTNVKDVNDYQSTELIRAIKMLNQGIDYRGRTLQYPTHFCIGSTIDLNRDIKQEVKLTENKINAGADFFIAQATHDITTIKQFLSHYKEINERELSAPVFYGVQILSEGSLTFGELPSQIEEDLAKGKPGSDIATTLMQSMVDIGINTFYIIPPILRGGRRDYAAAQQTIRQFLR